MTLKELVKNSIKAKINGQEVTSEMLLDCMDYVSENTPDVTEATAEQINDSITDWKANTLHQCEHCGKWVMDDETIVQTVWGSDANVFCSEKCLDEETREADAQMETYRLERTY